MEAISHVLVQFMESHVQSNKLMLQHGACVRACVAYMGDGHGIRIGGHREEFVVALLVEHPTNRSCSGVSKVLRSSFPSCCTGPIGLTIRA